MSGNVALDVVIGLVFIYLLYSLYATIIMEIFSSSCGLRARNLNYAVRRMLMDERSYHKHKIKLTAFGKVRVETEVNTPRTHWFFQGLSRILASFLQPFGWTINMKNRSLYDTFFKQPSIVSLCAGGISNKPSYLSAENFSKALIDSLKGDEEDLSVLASVQAGLDDNTLLPADSETKKQLLSLLKDANNDLAKFKILLERWYNDTMERSIGWFKRSTQVLLVVIGFVLVISFNVDSIAIIKKLSQDKDAREQLVKLATDFENENRTAIEFIKTNDTAKLTADLNARLDSLHAIRKSLETDMKSARNILASDWNVPDRLTIHPKTFSIPKTDTALYFKNDSMVVFSKSLDVKLMKRSLRGKEKKKSQIKVSTLHYKIWYVLNINRVWGYLLTVLALSMGAPFWFDLLNKLVKLRTSKSVETSSAQSSSPSGSGSDSTKATLNRVG